MTQKQAVTGILVVCVSTGLLSGCSAMLIGDGGSKSPPIGSENRSSTQVAADDALAQAVSHAISAEPSLSDADVAVKANSGTITIAGTVGSFTNRDTAVQVAGGVAGVSRVDNQLQVKTKD